MTTVHLLLRSTRVASLPLQRYWTKQYKLVLYKAALDVHGEEEALYSTVLYMCPPSAALWGCPSMSVIPVTSRTRTSMYTSKVLTCIEAQGRYCLVQIDAHQPWVSLASKGNTGEGKLLFTDILMLINLGWVSHQKETANTGGLLGRNPHNQSFWHSLDALEPTLVSSKFVGSHSRGVYAHSIEWVSPAVFSETSLLNLLRFVTCRSWRSLQVTQVSLRNWAYHLAGCAKLAKEVSNKRGSM